MGEQLTYRVPGMHCGHCERAVSVSVTGSSFDDAAVRAAIVEAGYEAA